MPLQYISDTEGNHTAVLIPINEWQLIVQTHEDLRVFEAGNNNTQKQKPSDFAGSLPANVASEFHDYIEKSRKEWN